MTLRLVGIGTTPGEGAVNEDRAGFAGETAWVVDGATQVTENFLDVQSDANWLADQVHSIMESEHIRQRIVDEPSQTFGAIADEVSRRLTEQGFPVGALPPACSVGVVSRVEDGLQVSIVGDVFVVLSSVDQVVRDERFGVNEKRAAGSTQSSGLGDDEARQGIVSRRRMYIDGPGDMFVLSRSRRVSAGVKTLRFPAAVGERALIMSDGFARLVEPYDVLATYGDLLRFVTENGVPAAMRLLRDHEAQSTDAGRNHFKAADDAAAVLVEIEE